MGESSSVSSALLLPSAAAYPGRHGTKPAAPSFASPPQLRPASFVQRTKHTSAQHALRKQIERAASYSFQGRSGLGGPPLHGADARRRPRGARTPFALRPPPFPSRRARLLRVRSRDQPRALTRAFSRLASLLGSPNPGEKQVTGFFTAHRFRTLPDVTRLRLSQLIVLFPYRRKGYAAAMIEAMRAFALKENAVRSPILNSKSALPHERSPAPPVIARSGEGRYPSPYPHLQVDYTVEDPTDAFQRRRDISDVAAARKACAGSAFSTVP